MSRSGYSDDVDQWRLIMYRGRVASATRGRRGQKMLRELLEALDTMPEQRLVASSFEKGGNVCALGALAKAKGIDTKALEGAVECGANKFIADQFDVATCLVNEVMYENDQDFYWQPTPETPERRWSRMRQWVASQITTPAERTAEGESNG